LGDGNKWAPHINTDIRIIETTCLAQKNKNFKRKTNYSRFDQTLKSCSHHRQSFRRSVQNLHIIFSFTDPLNLLSKYKKYFELALQNSSEITQKLVTPTIGRWQLVSPTYSHILQESPKPNALQRTTERNFTEGQMNLGSSKYRTSLSTQTKYFFQACIKRAS
jgi:hypothetical protein